MASLTKPKIPVDDIKAFAERPQGPQMVKVRGRAQDGAPDAPTGSKSGMVPAGDVRLTVNVRDDIHQRLKIRAVQEKTTVGDMIEAWVESW